MRFLFLDTNYEAFLRPEYAGSDLAKRPYAAQMAHLIGRRFGTSDFYSRNLRALGHEAQDVIANCAPLQLAWWREHKGGRLGGRLSRPSLERIVQEQVRQTAPDVLYVQEMNWPTASLLRRLRLKVPLIVGQTAYPLLPGLDVGAYDLVVSSFPHYRRLFELLGVPALYLPLAFEPCVLDEATTPRALHPQEPVPSRRDPAASAPPSADVAFVGSYSHDHAPATRLLESIARDIPTKFWGPSVESLSPDSPIRANYQGEAWGLDMFRVLAGARVTLNRHIEVAGPYANNMRLYEATGMGSLLLTDAKANLPDLFEPGREVVTYTDAADAIQQLRGLLDDEPMRKRIAAAGQRRTLKHHTYAQRMEVLAAHLEAMRGRVRPAERRILIEPASLGGTLAVRAGRIAMPAVRMMPTAMRTRLASAYRRWLAPPGASVSGAYRKVGREGLDLAPAWQDAAIVGPQVATVRQELVRMYCGPAPAVFASAAEAVRRTGVASPLVAEVGSATGAYEEVLHHLVGPAVRYAGFDYSPGLLAAGRSMAPSRRLVLADATRLPVPDGAADILLSGCVLLHLPDWKVGVRESARAAAWVIFHRTPVLTRDPTTLFEKQAYGVPVMEWAFNEAELLQEIGQAGLEVVWTTTLHSHAIPGLAAPAQVRTYLCRRTPQ